MIKKLIAGNWKMHLGPQEAEAFVAEFLQVAPKSPSVQWALFPTYVTLPKVAEKLKGSGISWGAQNCHWESKGAFTGEIATGMLKELGCHYTLVGHSERRQLFGETDATCALKVKALEDSGITPMLCIGETKAERESGATNEVVKRQLSEGLKHHHKGSALVIAYEPVWAIGTGLVATPPMVEETHKVIRQIVGSDVPILYGGSVKPENSRDLIVLPNVDGFLVGGASLVPKTFAQIGVLPL